MLAEDRLNLIQVFTIFIYFVVFGILGSISYVYNLLKRRNYGYRKT